MTKFVVVSGGVISGVGKGVTSAAIAKIMQAYGFSVTLIKIDPYLNCDAGTLRPTEHGEVWVTSDGGEIDQDLGTYERFINQDLPRQNSITTGQVYATVINRERHGEYLGATVQFIPHIVDEIAVRVRQAAAGYEIAVVEVGGTVGDFENVPFLYALKSLYQRTQTQNVLHVLVSYLPIPKHTGEMKTKPTQQAVRLLNQEGITADLIICRAERAIDEVRRQKIASFAKIGVDGIIAAPDVASIYQVPLEFEQQQVGVKILQLLGLTAKRMPNWQPWKTLVARLTNVNLPKVRIAIIGKYLHLGDYSMTDSYLSVQQALLHAAAQIGVQLDLSWLDAQALETADAGALKKLAYFDGILVPGGFGAQGIDGKLRAIQFAREQRVPYLGLCYGMQLAVIEFARQVAQLPAAHTTEIMAETPAPVVTILPIQSDLIKTQGYGGTMRLGNFTAQVQPDSLVAQLYQEFGKLDRTVNGTLTVTERHRHRYEINPVYVAQLSQAGLNFSGSYRRADGTELMEFIELPDHPFFVATQAHPEFNSRLEAPAPLFMGFMRAAQQHSWQMKQD